MFLVKHKVTGEAVTVYAVMNGLALIFTGNWEWMGINDFLPAEVTGENE